MAYQTGDNNFAYSQYIVDILGGTQYSTIQAAINQANADGGGVVYIRPGNYAENLTLYSLVSIQGDSNAAVTITGVHTPPVAGAIDISFVNLASATDIFFSAAAGAATITLRDCDINCTNGYAFNLANWTARLTVSNCTENSTDNHGVNNSGACSVLISDSNFGNSITPMTLSGDVEIYESNIAAPLSITGAGDLIIDNGSTLLEGITIADTVTGDLKNCSLDTGLSVPITTTSGSPISLANIVINSSAATVIDGTGDVQFGEVTFLDSNVIAGTVGKLYGTQITTGSLALPNTTATADGTITLGGTRFLSNYGTNNTFVGSSGNTTLTGARNSCLAGGAGVSLSTGSDNCCYGCNSGTGIQTGSWNSYFGEESGSSTDGEYNVCIGYSSLFNVVGVTEKNVIIGATAGSAYTTTESGNIIIGFAVPGIVGESYATHIGIQGTQLSAYIAGIYNTTPAGTAYPVVIDSNGQLGSSIAAHVMIWTTATTDAVPVINNTGYVVKNAAPANLTTFTLPATAAVGDTLIISGYTAGGWLLAQNAGQQIFAGAAATTIGVGGSLASTLAHDNITLVCITADTEWNMVSSVGNITVV